jgi:hypothetical protein
MVMMIETPSSKANMSFDGDLSESYYQGLSNTAHIQTAPHNGVVIVVTDEDEFGNTWRYKIDLSADDIAKINQVKR